MNVCDNCYGVRHSLLRRLVGFVVFKAWLRLPCCLAFSWIGARLLERGGDYVYCCLCPLDPGEGPLA